MDDNLLTLLAQSRSGNAEAFLQVLTQYSPLLNHMVRKYSESAGLQKVEKEDVRQEAVLAFYRAVCTYKIQQEEVTFGLYAKICVQNRIVSCLRKWNRMQKEMEEWNEASGRMTEEIAVDDPAEQVVEKESYRVLFQKMNATLTPFERTVFQYYVLEKPYREIAQTVGKTEKSVDNAICRIKAKLKKLV